MPKLKPTHVFLTDEEDAIITAAAMSDPDAIPFTDEEWEAVKPFVRIGGRPPSTRPLKVPTTIRFDADVLAILKATGKGIPLPISRNNHIDQCNAPRPQSPPLQGEC